MQFKPKEVSTPVNKFLIPDTKGNEFKVTRSIKQDNEENNDSVISSNLEHSQDEHMQAEVSDLSHDMRFQTMWYMRPAKPQISLPDQSLY